MGLAEPRKRIKISHDPRNTTWTNSTNSYGQRLMQQQGWKAGEALGANGKGSNYADAEAAKVNVKYKDDMLGLGASLKSKDIANQRTGFDAFQGLLGRLNAKTEQEVEAVEKKLEDKKLAMFAQGRWGGMVFVPGGLLVQSDPYKQIQALREAANLAESASPSTSKAAEETKNAKEVVSTDQQSEKSKRKAEKKQRKEEKRLKKEAKRLKKVGKSTTDENDEEEISLPTPDSSSANEGESSTRAGSSTKSKKRERSPESAVVSTATYKPVAPIPINPRNGRHLLRGKNIQAKRMAFSDMKGLDEIFMKAG